MYLVYHVNKGLGSFPTEISHHIELAPLREDGRDQRYALFRAEGVADQPFPGWGVAAYERGVGQRMPDL